MAGTSPAMTAWIDQRPTPLVLATRTARVHHACRAYSAAMLTAACASTSARQRASASPSGSASAAARAGDGVDPADERHTSRQDRLDDARLDEAIIGAAPL